jgi:hypothetical protein
MSHQSKKQHRAKPRRIFRTADEFSATIWLKSTFKTVCGQVVVAEPEKNVEMPRQLRSVWWVWTCLIDRTADLHPLRRHNS